MNALDQAISRLADEAMPETGKLLASTEPAEFLNIVREKLASAREKVKHLTDELVTEYTLHANLREKAGNLMTLLRANVGDNADWPVELVSDDTAVAESIAKELTELEAALATARKRIKAYEADKSDGISDLYTELDNIHTVLELPWNESAVAAVQWLKADLAAAQLREKGLREALGHYTAHSIARAALAATANATTGKDGAK